jgi:hypothetical protein
MKVNSMGVLIREWKITVQLANPKYGDYTELSTTIYHTNEAMAKVAGVKKLEDRLDITMDEEDWGYSTTAEVVE